MENIIQEHKGVIPLLRIDIDVNNQLGVWTATQNKQKILDLLFTAIKIIALAPNKNIIDAPLPTINTNK